jgi:hypothetical protein
MERGEHLAQHGGRVRVAGGVLRRVRLLAPLLALQVLIDHLGDQ